MRLRNIGMLSFLGGVLAITLAAAQQFTSYERAFPTQTRITDLEFGTWTAVAEIPSGDRILPARIDLRTRQITYLSMIQPGIQVALPKAIARTGEVVGQFLRANTGYACYWDANGNGYQLLSAASMATDITADGSVIVGWLLNRGFLLRPQSNLLVTLGLPGGQTVGNTKAHRVSEDGRVVAGWFEFLLNPLMSTPQLPVFSTVATTWRLENGVYRGYLHYGLNGGVASSVAALSADGSVAVGQADIVENFEQRIYEQLPVLWRGASPTPEVLGSLGGPGIALSVDARGKRIVGEARVGRNGPLQAFLWTPVRGMEVIHTRFASVIPSGWQLTSALKISPDGRYIFGIGTAPSGRSSYWLLDTGIVPQGDVDENGCVDDSDLLRVLFVFGQTSPGLGEDLNDDGTVDDADLLLVLFNFGQGC